MYLQVCTLAKCPVLEIALFYLLQHDEKYTKTVKTQKE